MENLVYRDRGEALLLLHRACLQVATATVHAVIDHPVGVAVWKPDSGKIPGGKNRDARCLHGCRKMHRAAVMPHKDAASRHHGRTLARAEHSAEIYRLS